jgi:transposase
MGSTNKSKRYSLEVRSRAVRLFQEHVHEYASRWMAMQSIAVKIGCTTETLRAWVVKSEASGDPRRTTVLVDRERIKELERENAELRRINEILRKVYFAQAELDRGGK